MGDERPDGLLATIETPADLRALKRGDLAALSEELRQYLIQTVGQMGGHLAAGLGSVELAVALHYVFDTPYDRLIWDVGHQAYPHNFLARQPTLKFNGYADEVAGLYRGMDLARYF